MLIKGGPIDWSVNIAVVISHFNAEITEKLLEGAMERLNEYNCTLEQVTVVKVPGVVEIPLVVKCLAKKSCYDAIICLGAVIRGETTHYDYVCEQVSQGCQRVMLNSDVPVIFGVLTTEDRAQALDRVGGNHGHKGRDAVDAAFDMISVLEQLA